ncbi:MAG: methyltransferase [Candidatus Altiarchaeales archaeon]|nr:methyltransferase [Candidatus Altiarchaeales archaeon]
MKLETHPEVYQPAEDSHLLADNLDVQKGESVLDVGVGSGIIALTAAEKALKVVGVDVNPNAVKLACKNARINKIHNVEFRQSNLFENVNGKFDLITFNPPYLPVCEKGVLRDSWSGGVNGLEVVWRFLKDVKKHLKPGGRILLVVSSLNGLNNIEGMLAKKGLSFAVKAECKIPFETLYLVQSKSL